VFLLKTIVSGHVLRALHQYPTEQSIAELTLSVGYWGMVARFLVPLHIDIDAQSAGSAQDLTGRKS